jgi:methanogenesis imperfect marker protein 11
MSRFMINEFLARHFADRAASKSLKAYTLVDEESGLVEYVGKTLPEMGGLISPEVMQYMEGPVMKNPLVVSSDSMGTTYSTRFREGTFDREMIPSYRFLDYSMVEIKEDTVHLTMKGIGGVPAGMKIMHRYGSIRTDIKEEGGVTYFDVEYPKYRKVAIGLDDTDSAAKGATYITVYRIAKLLESSLRDVHFINLCICINFPGNPYKTTNNASSAAIFAVRDYSKDQIIQHFKRLAKKHTISEDTGMAAREGIGVPDPLWNYTDTVRRKLVEVSLAMKAADMSRSLMFPITGERGLIGALSAVGMTDKIKEGLYPAV